MSARRSKERRRGTPRAWVARYMRLPLIVAAISCSFVHADEARTLTARPAFNSKEMGLRIDVRGDGWGSASRESIETLLYSVADELLSRLPANLAVPIIVAHTDRSPAVLFERGPAGEYQVQLHASGENWHLYVYEFAHELCHILSNFDDNAGARDARYNQWFEETLCETASLFALKNLAARWESTPPAPRWSEAARKLRRFFDHLVSEGHRQLPPHTPLTTWLQENEEQLRRNPYLRQKNEVVANLLLPLFRDDPQDWAALGYLDLDPAAARNNLRNFLLRWYTNAPLEHKHFVAGILAMFRLDDLVPMTPALAAATGQERTGGSARN